MPCMPQLFFTDADAEKRQGLSDRFYRGVMQRGLFFVEWHQSFIMLSHTERDIDTALSICEDAMAEAKSGA